MYTFGDWWHNLSGWQQLFWTGAIIGSVLLLIRSVLTLVDADSEQEPVELWNGSNVLTFFTFFFWTGIVALNLGSPIWLTLILAILMAAAIVGVVHYILSTDKPVFTKKDVVDHTAKVQVDIPPHRIGHGRVEIEVRGALMELDAVTIGNDELPTGLPVRVVDVVNRRTLLVEPAPIELQKPKI
ncbi:MAG: hypothetical protein AB8G22_14375 [Saprospiraceae bacterium]